MDLPDWIKALGLQGHIRCNEYTDLIRLKGSSQDPGVGARDLSVVLMRADPVGYRLSYVIGKVEHKRGYRFAWMVTWLQDEEAERRYQEKQAKRMSRFAHEEEPA